MSWNGDFTGEVTIETWEPNRHLRTSWFEAEQHPTPLVVDYFVEARGGGTFLRLVHSGFSADTDWTDEYDGTRRGWSSELRCLKHYLENHRGTPRRIAKASREIKTSAEEGWTRLMSTKGLLREGNIDELKEGERCVITAAAGDRLEGEVRYLEPPGDLALSVEGLNNSLLRVNIERWGPSSPLTVRLWLSTWGLPENRVQEVEARLQGLLDELYVA
jgi:hypothetical protein